MRALPFRRRPSPCSCEECTAAHRTRLRWQLRAGAFLAWLAALAILLPLA